MPSQICLRPAWVWTIALLFGVTFLGCARPATVDFVPREDTELIEDHQSSLMAKLRRIYGTPTEPHLAVLNEELEPIDEDAPPILKEIADSAHLKRGATVYMARCSGCHGVRGDGQGPAAQYLRPRPRDYRDGKFKFTSTPYGEKPTRQDLVRTIRRGAKGTSMPAFPWMTDEDLDALIDYIVLLSERGETELKMVQFIDFELEEEDEVEIEAVLEIAESVRASWQRAETKLTLPATAEPLYNEESIRIGREVFLSAQANCWKCHGKDAKGQTQWLNPEFLAAQEAASAEERVQINYDDWKQPAPAADLTARMLHGGRRPIDIYRRVATGINGTPMQNFAGTFAEDPEKIWHLVHYVMHIVDGGDPQLGEGAATAPDTQAVDATTAPGATSTTAP